MTAGRKQSRVNSAAIFVTTGALYMEIIVGDCIEKMRTITKQFALVFADPPFNIGEKYEGYKDKLPRKQFQDWTTEWIRQAWRLVEPGGALALHGASSMLPIYWRSICSLGLDPRFEDEIAWHFRFAQCGYHNWLRGHCPCTVLRKGGAAKKWYPDNVLVESDRATKYKDKRCERTEQEIKDGIGKRRGKRPPYTIFGLPSDGPGWGIVTANSKERRPLHSNQLPIRYVRRIVLAYTQVGDSVLDPFLGSGTTGIVCHREEREFTGIEQSQKYADSAMDRILNGYYPEFA